MKSSSLRHRFILTIVLFFASFSLILLSNNNAHFTNALEAKLQNQIGQEQRFIFKSPPKKPLESVLLKFFTAWNPPLIKNIDSLVIKYQHNSNVLFNSIKKIYNVNHFDGKPTPLQFNLIQFYMKHYII